MMTRYVFRLCFCVLGFCLSVVAQGAPHIALSAGPKQPWPAAQGSGVLPGNFEWSAVSAGTFLYRAQFLGGNTAWAPWTMLGSTGIASNGSGFLNFNTNPANSPAPEGTRVAFVQGMGRMSTSYSFPAGISRLCFEAAQRVTPASGINNQRIRIELTVGATTVEILEIEPESQSYSTYTTRPFHFDTQTIATVSIIGSNSSGDQTLFIDNMQIEPVADWNEQQAWNVDNVPLAQSDVVIPASVAVALRGAAIADTVTVEGELLTALDSAKLEARWVMVTGSDAHFEVGRELTPHETSFELMLAGSSGDPAATFGGTKFLMAMNGGRIDMHGAPKRSWTKLISIGTSASSIIVEDASGWQVHDDIVISYTGHISSRGRASQPNAMSGTPYVGPRSQMRRITGVDAITGALSLSAPIDPADHCTAAIQVYNDGNSSKQWTLDQRAEVGMLSHNVVVRGEATPAELLPFGGHVMLMATDAVSAPGEGRFSNVELFDMGQTSQLGRYPIHWHMQTTNGSGQYIRNSSIHVAHNRAITVHGTDGVEVRDNVCFDVMGHAVFLEDGVERDNEFIGNLVLGVREPFGCYRMLPHDNSTGSVDLDVTQNRTPAAFWISHPDNFFENNVVADSGGVGYWFALHENPTGISLDPQWNLTGVVGHTAPLGSFVNNKAHSMKLGMDVHDSIAPDVDTSCQPIPPILLSADPRDDNILRNRMWDPPVNASIMGFTAYGCSMGIYTGGGIEPIGSIHFDDCVLADNGAHLQLASMDLVKNSVLVHDSGNSIFPTGGNGMSNAHLTRDEEGLAYVFYDGPARLRDCHLVGYSSPGGAELFHTHFGAARRHTDHRVSGLTFDNEGLPVLGFDDFAAVVGLTNPTSSQALLMRPELWGFTVVDEDSSLNGGVAPLNAGSFPASLICNHPMMHVTGPAGTPDIGASPDAGLAYWSPYKWAHLQVTFYEGPSMVGPLSFAKVPKTTFVRRSFVDGSSWSQRTFVSDYDRVAQMRQLPVIVNYGATATPDYEVRVANPGPAVTLPVNRVDVSVDDFYDGDRVRLWISHDDQPTWSPTVYLNDGGDIYQGAQNPSIVALPQVPVGDPTTAVETTCRIAPIASVTTIEIVMVKPANGKRAHRVAITW